MNKEIYILGVGHNTIVYIDLLEQCGYSIRGLYHYNQDMVGDTYWEYPVVGSYDDLYSMNDLKGMCFALSMGDNKWRRIAFERIVSMGGEIPTLIHPKADVSRYAQLGQGVVVQQNSVIDPDTIINDNTIIGINTIIHHSSKIGSHCFVGSSVLVGAYTQVCDNVFIGLGAILISGKVPIVRENAIIGAGAVVSASVEANTIVAGVPARILK